MTPGRICLLHSVDDAHDFLAGPLYGEGWTPFSTHCSAAAHLKARGVACRDVSEWILLDDQLKAKQANLPGGALLAESNRILIKLDNCIPGDWWQRMGLRQSLPLFPTMYHYLIEHSLSGREVFTLALERILAEHPADEVLVYHQDPRVPNFDVQDVLEQMLPVYGFQLNVRRSSGRSATTPLPVQPIRPRFSVYAQSMRRRLQAFARWLKPSSASKMVQAKEALLIFQEGPLHGLTALCFPFDILPWPTTGLPSVPGIDAAEIMTKAEDVCLRIVSGLKASAPPYGVGVKYWQRFAEEFERHGAGRLAALGMLELLLRSQRVSAIAWYYGAGADPARALMARYSLLNGVPVAGVQHGGNYGVQDCGDVFMRTDFTMCSRFISFGITSNDLDESLRCRIPCEIVPLPISSSKPMPTATLQNGPVVFPLTDCQGLLGCERRSPAVLAAAQEAILSALDSRTDLDVWVKPFEGATSANLSCTEQIKNLRHAKVGGGPFQWFLAQKRPRLLITEFPSSPLYEALHYDMDIFVLMDPLFPFTPEAERMLRARVHFFETAEALAQAILDYGKGSLPRLRDMEFATRFQDRSNVEQRLAKAFIEWSECWPGRERRSEE